MKHFPYCPNKDCLHHSLKDKPSDWFAQKGYYTTRIGGRLPRYRCKSCGKTFVQRTFSIDYYTKRIINYERLYTHIKTSSGIRDMARDLNCTTASVLNRISRLSRKVHAAEALYGKDPFLKEDFSTVRLVSLIGSKGYSSILNVLTGKNSQYIYDFSSCYVNRNKSSKRKSGNLEKNGRKRSIKDILDTVDRLHKRSGSPYCCLHTTTQTDYLKGLKSHPSLGIILKEGHLIHRQYPSGKSHNRNSPLFSCDYLNRQIRKDLAEHVRETVQFTKDMNNSAERFTVYRFWHNYEKPWRIHRKDRVFETHADAAGVSPDAICSVKTWFAKGFRVPLSLLGERLNPFSRNIWFRKSCNPSGPSGQYLPHYCL